MQPPSHVSMYVTQIIPFENGDYKVEGTINWSGLRYDHKIKKIRVEPPCHVSMYITQITPLENGDYEGEGNIKQKHAFCLN